MKRSVWSIVILIVAAVAVWGVTASRRARLESDIESVQEIEDAGERIAAIVELARARGGLKSEHMKLASDGISEAAYEMGEADGLVAVCDSLLALELPKELKHRLTGELHNGIVIQGHYEEEDKRPYWRRASDVARTLLEGDDVPPDVLLAISRFHQYALDFVTPEEIMALRDHWLPYELATRGFLCLESPVSDSDTAVLSGALGRTLARVSEASGVARAVAVTDSLLAQDPCPSMRAVILANRYDVAADEDPELALAAASELAEVGRRPGFMSLMHAVSSDLIDRKLDPTLALELAHGALELAESRSDSSHVYVAIGLSHRAIGNLDEAANALELAVAADDETPEIDDARVDALLSIYSESSRNDRAIELVCRLLGRSAVPSEEARAKLADLLDAEGRSEEEIPGLIETQRYTGVHEAPDFTLIDRAGNEVSLLGLRGNVVMLCFWSYD